MLKFEGMHKAICVSRSVVCVYSLSEAGQWLGALAVGSADGGGRGSGGGGGGRGGFEGLAAAEQSPRQAHRSRRRPSTGLHPRPIGLLSPFHIFILLFFFSFLFRSFFLSPKEWSCFVFLHRFPSDKWVMSLVLIRGIIVNLMSFSVYMVRMNETILSTWSSFRNSFRNCHTKEGERKNQSFLFFFLKILML